MTRLRMKIDTKDYGEEIPNVPGPLPAERWEAVLHRHLGPCRWMSVWRVAAPTERAARRRVLREFRRILERDLEQLAELERGEG